MGDLYHSPIPTRVGSAGLAELLTKEWLNVSDVGQLGKVNENWQGELKPFANGVGGFLRSLTPDPPDSQSDPVTGDKIAGWYRSRGSVE